MLQTPGYAGWLVVEAEQDPKKAHPLTYATMGFDNLDRMAKEAGFTVTVTDREKPMPAGLAGGAQQGGS